VQKWPATKLAATKLQRRKVVDAVIEYFWNTGITQLLFQVSNL